ncbi:hypothetical protein J2S94_001591 [Arthrobacter bambusae]|nr:hypothetical protein [Arthrobacter bambusae]
MDMFKIKARKTCDLRLPSRRTNPAEDLMQLEHTPNLTNLCYRVEDHPYSTAAEPYPFRSGPTGCWTMHSRPGKQLRARKKAAARGSRARSSPARHAARAFRLEPCSLPRGPSLSLSLKGKKENRVDSQECKNADTGGNNCRRDRVGWHVSTGYTVCSAPKAAPMSEVDGTCHGDRCQDESTNEPTVVWHPA